MAGGGLCGDSREPRRLLFTGTNAVDTNASQQKLYFLARELERAGLAVDVAVPDSSDDRRLLDQLGFAGRRLFLPNNASVAEFHWAKRRILASGQWEAVHSIGIGVRSLTPSLCGVPVLHDFDEWMSTIRSLPRWRRAYWSWSQRIMCRRSFAVTCASTYLVTAVKRLRPDLGSRVLHMPVGVDLEELATNEDLLARLRERFATRRLLVYVGSITPPYREQVAELTNLAERLRDSQVPTVVLIAGGGEDLEHWRSQRVARRLEQVVEFEGPIPRESVASYLAAASALVFPFPPTEHNVARCPTKAFHYAAANKPLVTNRTGEVARLFGDDAFYYEPGNAEDMLRACRCALTSAPTFRHRIPIESLTWRSRATTYRQWLSGVLNREM